MWQIHSIESFVFLQIWALCSVTIVRNESQFFIRMRIVTIWNSTEYSYLSRKGPYTVLREEKASQLVGRTNWPWPFCCSFRGIFSFSVFSLHSLCRQVYILAMPSPYWRTVDTLSDRRWLHS
jgi:hypothetical protein